MKIAELYGVIQLKLCGSVLIRKEKLESDIEFLAIFDPKIPYDWEAVHNLEEELEQFFGKRVSIVDSRSIPDVFRLSIDTDPVDIMDLLPDIQYTITPKTSRLYYTMLDKIFRGQLYVKLESPEIPEGYHETAYVLWLSASAGGSAVCSDWMITT